MMWHHSSISDLANRLPGESNRLKAEAEKFVETAKAA